MNDAGRTHGDRTGGAIPPGLPDELFTRGDVPMTKREIRALTMSAAGLRPTDRVLDLGAGTGSLSVEAALLCPGGEVVALERDAAALELIAENVRSFGLANVSVVAGEAPEALAVLDARSFDRILVGGSGGNMGGLLEALPALLRPGGRVVCNTACLETTAAAAAALRRPPWTGFACSQISVARGVPAGRLLRFDALNPVWLTSADLEEA
jgi:precorrin-6Y C5,15-methyltransferase (decarboxylating) CbiT subunit